MLHPPSRDSSGHIFYWFTDQLGSTRTITTGSGPGQTPGQLCWDQDYTPYGQEVFTTSQMTRLQTTACPPSYKFTGYERDPETAYGATDTGLDYAFARYYSSRLGRFLSTDPLGGPVGSLQSHNAYAYVVNNPMNLTDPSGLCGGGGQAHAPTACPDPDRPGYGPCGLDCGIGGGGGSGGGPGGPGAYGGYCPAQFQGCIDNGNGGFFGLTPGGFAYNCDRPAEIADESDAGCDDAATLFFFMPGTSRSSALRNLLSKNKACADVLGGTDNALKILAAANQINTDASGFNPPNAFLGGEGMQGVVQLVINHSAAAATDFAADDSGKWKGGAFNVYVNSIFTGLNPSQRLTAFIHELHHVALGYGLASSMIDGEGDPFSPPQGPYDDFRNISLACGTQMINPPKKP